jgi:hypothetical protein
MAMHREKLKRKKSIKSFVLALIAIFMISLAASLLVQIGYSFYLNMLCKKTCENYNYTLEGKCCYCLFGDRKVMPSSWGWCR